MFYYLKGTLALLEDTFCVVDVGGVGYKVTISMHSFESLTEKRNEEVKVFIHYAVREDDVELFGFYTEEELDFFRLLITVSGVGPKAAISILSSFSPAELCALIHTNDSKTLSKAQGIGAKTSARIILDLHDKIPAVVEGEPKTISQVKAKTGSKDEAKKNEALKFLLALGYAKNDIMTVLKDLVIPENATVEDVVKMVMHQF